MAPPSPKDVATLNGVLDTVVKLLTDLLTHLESLDSEPTAPRDPEHAKIASIGVSHDAAMLIKAHSTKISLLIINEPFTPSAIIKVLKELLEAAIPALASAATACEPVRYTSGFSQELRFRCRRVLRCLRDLVLAVPRDGRALSTTAKGGSRDGRGSITTTSVLWAACDDVTKLQSLGVKGLLDEKIAQHRAILDDIKEELKEWKEENENGDSEDEDDGPDFDDDFDDDPQAQLDELMRAQKIPKDRTDIRSQLSPCITRLGLLGLLYKAISKRRIKELPDLPPAETVTGDKETTLEVVARVNEVYPILKNLPEDFGELVAAFYKLDAPLVESTRAKCFRQACAVGKLLRKPWVGENDAFSAWLDKFQDQMNSPADSRA